ncbi:GHKL domain-containing protein [Mucilaginibacter daejeonensis]|uniref:ATP-binding protein n=1 Tax=Mucilaginibacter daejeonensis TaxID=398049 RepID=UPI001D17B163|nr:ATP-binding protein [Mucilaginibacter daejeonensis]UEG53507.1 GHKL domain-containing protein [Mucilaginibacter daejeonensis]
MTNFAKIRILLALLCVSLLLLAVMLHAGHTQQEGFFDSARKLERNLHHKEKYAEELLSGRNFKMLKTLPGNSKLAAKLVDEVTVTNRIWLVTYHNNKLTYWSGIKVVHEDPRKVKEGISFRRESNGYYEAIRKTEGNFTAIAYIFIKNQFGLQNQYLQNTFEKDLVNDENLQVADLADKNVFPIHNRHDQYLFSVKSSDRQNTYGLFNWEMGAWAVLLLSLCLLISSIGNYFIHKKQIWASFGFMAVSLLAIRFVNLYFHFPDLSKHLRLFDPQLYSLNALVPSLGDLCLNILFLFWLVVYIYYNRHKIINYRLGRISSYAVLGGSIATLLLASTGLLYLFRKLVISSNINFDVNNVLTLSVYSMIGVTMACFAFLIFFLLVEILLVIDQHIRVDVKIKLIALLGSIALFTIWSAFDHRFTLFYILWGVIVLIRAYDYRNRHGQLNALSYISIIVICSFVASIKLNYFERIKEHNTRVELVKQLSNGDDAKIRKVFKAVEHRIVKDPLLIRYLHNRKHSDGFLKDHLERSYFDGYLSDYDCKVHEFDQKGEPLAETSKYQLNDFKDMVILSSFKLSDYFYREDDSFGFQSYFAILPVYEGESNLGTVIVELRSKPIHSNSNFPDLLIESDLRPDGRFKDYSYAFYSDGNLLSQSGKYDYDVVNTQLKGQLKHYVFKTTDNNEATEPSWFKRFSRVSHLIYQPSLRKVIVVSRERNIFFNGLTSLTFFFVMLLLFSALVILVAWLWRRVSVVKITEHSVHWHLRWNFENLLYKTRIQFSMIFAVVATLTLVGIITYISIRAQYQEQQDELISNKVTAIAAKFENTFPDDLTAINEQTQVKFANFADNFSADLILFDTSGVPVLSTQPKIYDYGLLGRRMHAKAFVMLKQMHRSLLVNTERIAGLTYKTAYVPIRSGTKRATVAYLQVPYFANEADYLERIGSFLNAMINIYALIFIAIGVFAVLIARQITNPLSFIQHSLSKTIYGKKNEPIKWDRDDEIGALVKEYNKMIAALENSANRLAQSERESAWREMAKQVAHEIKNPLTPLKLGLQLLEKSWKDKDAKFDIKFERFSKSFVEQIESLSNIASEFSAFAKMPDTKMQPLDVFEILGQAVIIFKHMDNVRIGYEAPIGSFMIMADRDQLLRCFNNLLKNAIEAMPPEHQGVVDITYTLGKDFVLLKIMDNGNGIPENLRERIFEPNFTTKSSGTGLGLAFVKNSIENAGGRVWFETAIGEGTTFYLNFPAAPANATAKA